MTQFDARIPMSLAILLTVAGAIVNLAAGPFDDPALAVSPPVGHEVIFSDDFSQDALGAAPRRWTLSLGSFEVAARGEEQSLRLASERGEIRPELTEALPPDWTLEFELLEDRPAIEGVTLAAVDARGRDVWSLEFGSSRGADLLLSAEGSNAAVQLPAHQPGSDRRTVSLIADGPSLLLVTDGEELLRIADLGSSGVPTGIAFRMSDSEATPLLGSLRVSRPSTDHAGRL